MLTRTGQTRWGIAGTGGIARGTVGDLHLAENVEVAAVSSRTQEGADAFAAAHEVPAAYGSFDAMLEDPTLDVIYLCSPHSAHAEMTVAALQAGKHVLCEKPLTLTGPEAREVVAVAEQEGRFLMEAMWMRFNPAIRALADLVASGELGEVRHVESAFGFAAPYDPAHRLWNPALGGGALLDLGIYPLTFAHMLLGRPHEVSVVGTMREDGVDGRAMVTLSYAGGATSAHASCSLEHYLAPTGAVSGTEGFAILEPPFWRTAAFEVHDQRIKRDSPPPARTEFPVEGAGYTPMFRAVSDAVAEGRTEHPVHPWSATLEVLDLIDEVRALLAAQHGVRLD